MNYRKASASPVPSSIARNRPALLLRNHGFTLVELILVTVVIGLLTIAALPAFNHAKQTTKNTNAVTQLRDIENALTTYALDKGGGFPDSLAALTLQRPLDPWGSPYQYHRVIRRSNRFLELLNEPEHPDDPSFDLYSMGPDGQTADSIDDPLSKDDVFRAANGSFMGTWHKYYP
jgi:general secretion pathway protein G